MILTKYSKKQFKKNGKVFLELPVNIRQYDCTEEQYKKANKKQKEEFLYSYKFFGLKYRKMLIEKLCKKNNYDENVLSFFAEYLLDCEKTTDILSKYKIKQIHKFEFSFSDFKDFDILDEEDIKEEVNKRQEIKIQYQEKQTKLYKLSQIPYIPNKSRWVTPNTNNVFEFNGVSYIINKDNKNYKCDAQNTSKMDRVFCAYTNDGIEFYDMNIDKIDAQLLQ